MYLNLLKKIIIAIMLAGLWGALFFQATHDREQAIAAAESNSSNLARAFEEHVKKTVQNIDGLLIQLRDEYRRNPQGLTESIQRLAQHKAAAELLIQVSVINKQGMMSYNTKGMPPVPLDLSDREHFKVHLEEKGDQLFISKPVLGRVSNKWSIQFTRKIYDEAGLFSGVMVLSIDPNYFSDYYKNIDVGPNGIIALVGMDREIRARAANTASDVDHKGVVLPQEHIFFRPTAPNVGNYTRASVIDGIERIFAYRRIKEYPLVVVVALAKHDVLARVMARTRNIYVAGVVVSITILVAAWLFWRSERSREELHAVLSDNEELFRTLFNQFPIGTAVVGKDCRINQFNAEFTRICGYSETELAAIDITEIIKPETEISFSDYCLTDRGINLNQVEALCCNKQGKQIPTLLTASPVFFQSGELRFSILTLLDITLLKQAENALYEHKEQLKQLNIQLEARVAEEVRKNREKDHLLLQQDKMASVGQLAAGVAHEINNPIGFVMSNLGVLAKYTDSLRQFCVLLQDIVAKRGTGEDQEVVTEMAKSLKIKYILNDIKNLIAESVDGTERVKRIVLDLKDFARTDEKGTKPTHINECINSTINMVRNEIKYVADLDLQLGELPQIYCSPNQINQVIANLLINAAHAIDKHGTITVATRLDNDKIVMTISDTGCGMTKEVQNRIFEPFFTTKEIGKGTGLGLTICYDIIHKHNGSIEVESEVGQGTKFIISLPIDAVSDSSFDI